tara:strand:+ start:1352 stop:1483 length:132 start_codon:yes stop_codon:yes gene_type:complete
MSDRGLCPIEWVLVPGALCALIFASFASHAAKAASSAMVEDEL